MKIHPMGAELLFHAKDTNIDRTDRQTCLS